MPAVRSDSGLCSASENATLYARSSSLHISTLRGGKSKSHTIFRRRFGKVLPALAISLSLAATKRGQGILIDGFNDGNDDGWTPHGFTARETVFA